MAERETVVLKEIHSFRQRSLDDKGVFLLDFASEAYLWIGKKVVDKDRLYMYQLALQHLGLLHQQSKDLVERIVLSIVESGYEPEIFKSAFVLGGWQNFEHTSQMMAKTNTISVATGEDEEQADGEIELAPDNVWIN